jgi:hypothetical protein
MIDANGIDVEPDVAVQNDGIDAIPEPGTEFQLSTAKPQTFVQKIKDFFRDPEMERAKSMNVYALSKATGLSITETYKNYDYLRSQSKYTGMKHEVTGHELMTVAIPGVLVYGTAAAAATVGWPAAIGSTAVGLLAFGAIDHVIPTARWIKEYEDRNGELPQTLKGAIEMVDFVGKGLLAHGITQKSSALANEFITKKLIEYKMPIYRAVLEKMEETTGARPTATPIEDTVLPNVKVTIPPPMAETSPKGSKAPQGQTPTPKEGSANLSKDSEIVASSTTVPLETNGVNERGFVTSMKESKKVTTETKQAIKDLPETKTTYDVYGDAAALERAKARVSTDPEGSLSFVLTSKEFDKDVSTTGLELMRRFRERGDIENEVNVAMFLAEQGTKAGQFIQAYSMLDKLSPDGVLVFASRMINQGVKDIKKWRKLDPAFVDRLKAQAEVVQNTPYGYQKVKEINALYDLIRQAKGMDKIEWLTEIANVPRTLMASLMDFSFGLRQGLFVLPTFAKEWGGAFSKQFGVFAKESKYDALMDAIMKDPNFRIAEKSGLSFTDIRGNLGKLEERYMGSKMAEKIPLVGIGVKATSRAYTAMANKLRMDIFNSMIRDMEKMGLDPLLNQEVLKQIATFVNAGTGRGGLGGVLKGAAPFLNAFFFSPRLMSSRLTLLNPVYYITRAPGVRQQAVKSLFGFMGTWATMLTMAKLSGLEVGTDPRSSDFSKIKIGDTRIDLGGGFAQYMRMAGQLITGEYVSSTTGKVLTLGEGFKPLSRYDIIFRQLESKESPIFSLLTTILKQQDWQGQKINVPKEVALRFVPMIIQDMYDLAQEDPALIPLGILTVFGIGVQTYGDKTKLKL